MCHQPYWILPLAPREMGTAVLCGGVRDFFRDSLCANSLTAFNHGRETDESRKSRTWVKNGSGHSCQK
jgi:hypothetical protein